MVRRMQMYGLNSVTLIFVPLQSSGRVVWSYSESSNVFDTVL
jgi:hypothetical protein